MSWNNIHLESLFKVDKADFEGDMKEKDNRPNDDICLMTSSEIIAYYDTPFSKSYREASYFKERKERILSLLAGLFGDSLLDIGAGDAYWPSLIGKVFDTYFGIEQGESNCRDAQLRMKDKCKKMTIIKSDAFSCDYSLISSDTVFLGFFCSHYYPANIKLLLGTIKEMVSPKRIVLLDSFWSEYRKKKFSLNNMKLHKRIIGENQGRISVPKRYLSVEEINQLGHHLQMDSSIDYCDDYWCLAHLSENSTS